MRYVKCAECGADISAKIKYVLTKTSESKKPYHNSNRELIARFCDKCGEDLSQTIGEKDNTPVTSLSDLFKPVDDRQIQRKCGDAISMILKEDQLKFDFCEECERMKMLSVKLIRTVVTTYLKGTEAQRKEWQPKRDEDFRIKWMKSHPGQDFYRDSQEK